MLTSRFAAIVILSHVGWSAPSSLELLDALQSGDGVRIRQLVDRGAPVNAVDEFGASALMYAALYCDAPVVRLLLDKGADPNRADRSGATALMWSVSDEAKVRYLLARGAKVNTSSPRTGRTPLLIAAGRPGGVSSVKLLLRKGADPMVRDKQGNSALLRATYSGNIQNLRVLIRRGIDVNAPGDFGLTPLLEAAIQGNRQMVEMLLDKGADPRTHDQDGFTALTSALSFRNPSVFRLLIRKGSDPRARSNTGVDLLMAAAASDSTGIEIIQDLQNLHVDPRIGAANFHTQHGYGEKRESPLDWAARRGQTPVSLLLAKWAGGALPQDRPEPQPRLHHKDTPRAAVERALSLLLRIDIDFFKRGGCVSCHSNALAALAYELGRAKGIVLDEQKVKLNRMQMLASVVPLQDDLLQDLRFPSGEITAAYLLLGLDSAGQRRDRSTDALVQHLAVAQAVDGAWRVRTDRPPIESGRVTVTALSVRALRAYGFPGRKTEFDRRVNRAAKWLGAYLARTGEEKAMRLAGLAWAAVPDSLIRDAAERLCAVQRPDGGWGQLDSLPSDAYTTGQTLHALQVSGMLRDDILQKGVRFLLDSQFPDGSWHVRSRSYPIQPNYFESGFPHGRD
jgi:ankyrin repeat protein